MDILSTKCYIPYEGRIPIKTMEMEEEIEGSKSFIPNRWKYEEYNDFYLFRNRDTSYNRFFILKKDDFNLNKLLLYYYTDHDSDLSKCIRNFLNAFVGRDTIYFRERKLTPTVYQKRKDYPDIKLVIEFKDLTAKDLFKQQFTTVTTHDVNEHNPTLIPLSKRKFKGLDIADVKYDKENITVTLSTKSLSVNLVKENKTNSSWFIDYIEVNNNYKAKDPNNVIVDTRKVLGTLQYNGLYWIDLTKEETQYYKDLISVYQPELKDLPKEEVTEENNKTKALLKNMVLDLLKESNIKTTRLYL